MYPQEYLSHKQVISLIKAVGHTRTVLVMGENGIGKTAIAKALRNDPDFADFSCPSPVDCTQLTDGSLYMPDLDRERGVSRELPNERFGLSATRETAPVLLFFDEIAKIPQFVKNMLAPILYDRRFGTLALPPRSHVVAFTNLTVEGLGDFMEPNIRNRLVVVKMRKSTADEWVSEYAIPNNLHPELIACVEEYPQVFDSFLDYMPGGKYSTKTLEKDNPDIYNPAVTQEAYASPRSLHAASDVLYGSYRLDTQTLHMALTGVVGASFGARLMSFVKFGQQTPRLADIVADPINTPLPENRIAQQILVFKFLSSTHNRDQAQAYSQYMARMQPEYQQLFVRRVTSTAEAIAHFSTVEAFNRMFQDAAKYYSPMTVRG